MGWIILIVVVIVALYLIHQHGKWLSGELGVSSDSHSIREGLDAVKKRQDTKWEKHQHDKAWEQAGKAFGDKRLGKVMKGALDEMTEECPKCGGAVWNEAEYCGHCGASLRSN